MLYQTFDATDWPRLLTLAFVELALSADNAIVLSMLSRSLPERLRSRALTLGIISAFFLRGASLFALSILLHSFWIQLAGGAYLIYLSTHHFISSKRKQTVQGRYSFWKTFILIELFDLAFAIDSMLAGLALIASPDIETTINPKLWIVYFGGIIGVIGIRRAAHWFSKIIDRFPRLETSAFLLIGWIGLKLCYVSIESNLPYKIPFEPLFWIGMILCFLWGFWDRKPKNPL